jgi:hypothetical protein
VPLIAKRTWATMSLEERRASGAKLNLTGLCSLHYYRSYRGRTTWRAEDLIEEAEFLFEGGASAQTVASRLGLQYRSLIRAYDRARNKGLTTRKLTDPGSKRD